ncbi:hypothetical protein BUALT_BualtUnG0007900 [Buddleja alternifolia]|uniref:Reverse transcriptase RNase H-like domain-containing protein n=1 Tax=Buddleja alternifolia TaxID=168488 RepID=A0AAV6W0R5_9LAMI|nr:hypothetical protein BUALT_BualtUnG0007900 [Buddleja alternifolia]
MSKCQFGSPTVEYLGYVISKAGVEMDPNKIQAVKDWPLPKNSKQLRVFFRVEWSPILILPDFTKEFIVETDASGQGIGAVLLQMGKPIAFMSKALTGRNLGLSVYEKELMVVVVAVQKRRPYMIEKHFTIKIDHQSLKHLLEQRISTPS